jgi:hypothetical protein
MWGNVTRTRSPTDGDPRAQPASSGSARQSNLAAARAPPTTTVGVQADASARTPDTGHRTPSTGHRPLDTGHRPLDTDTGHRTRGRWTRAPDNGRADSHARTLTEDADRAPKPPTPLGHRTMSLWAAHAALGNHDGSAVRPPCQCARLPTALPGSCSVAPPAANRRLGALLSCVGFGWYEGRAMALRKGEVCRVRLGGEC